jgi:hypothetical protein
MKKELIRSLIAINQATSARMINRHQQQPIVNRKISLKKIFFVAFR